MENILSKIEHLALNNDRLTPDIIKQKNIKLGLRNSDGTGVIAGITSKGSVLGTEKIPTANGDGYTVKAIPGRLIYCGYDVIDMVRQLEVEGRFGFEECIYLLLTGVLPSSDDLDRFTEILSERTLLSRKERSVLLQETENENQMYALHSVISHLSRCDKRPDSTQLADVSEQCINIIAKMPSIVAYNHQAQKFRKTGNLSIVKPQVGLSVAENFLYMLKGKRPTDNEAKLFDLCLVLHAEHGGGNNSTFTVRSVSSSGANTYMAICSGIASLSGHLHGGANEAVVEMMQAIKTEVADWGSEAAIRAYLEKVLAGQAGDGRGKIYGMGHAVYTVSDPRAIILREKAEGLAKIKGAQAEFELYRLVEKVATELLSEKRGKAISANVDFYSGLIYKMMGIPIQLFTPIFAMSRVVGWSAHRIEQIVQDKIIRPAYISTLACEKSYLPLSLRA